MRILSKLFSKIIDRLLHIPVSVNVAGTVGVAEVNEGGVDHDLLLALGEQVRQVAQVPIATPYAVPKNI